MIEQKQVDNLVADLASKLGNSGLAVLSGTLQLNNASFYVDLQAHPASANWTFTFPTDGGTAGQVLSTDGSGGTSWVAAPSGSGTDSYLARWGSSPGVIEDSSVTDDGATLTIATSTGASITATTVSTTFNDGALVVAGGIGIGGNVNSAGYLVAGAGGSSPAIFDTAGITFDANQTNVTVVAGSNQTLLTLYADSGTPSLNVVTANALLSCNGGLTVGVGDFTISSGIAYIGSADISGTVNFLSGSTVSCSSGSSFTFASGSAVNFDTSPSLGDGISISFSDGTDTVTLGAPTSGGLNTSYSLVLPLDGGSNGDALRTDGSGNLYWGA